MGAGAAPNGEEAVEALHRRSVLVRLTDKGEIVRDMLRELFDRHLGSLEAVGNVAGADLDTMNTSLRRMERFWIDQVRFRL